MKTRMMYLPISLLISVAFLLASCSPAVQTPTPANIPQEITTSVPTVVPTIAPTLAPTALPHINLTFWYEWDQANNPQAYAWSQDIVAAYETSHPNVTVDAVAIPDQEYDIKFQTAVASGTTPDGFMARPGSWFQPYVTDGIAQPLDTYLSVDGWGDSFLQSAMDVCTYGGSVYCLPGGIRSVQIWYNVDLFTNNNLKVPTTWAELDDVITALKAKGITPFALGNKEAWEAPLIYEFLLIRNGGYQNFLDAASRDGKAKFNDPPFVDAATKLQAMSTNGDFPKGVNGLAFGDMLTQFFSGKAAMAVFLNVMPGIASGSAPKGFNLDYFNFPSMGGDTTGLVSSIGGAWAISAKSKNKDQMADFLRFWTSRENMSTLSQEAGWVMSVKNTISQANTDPMTWRIYSDINNASVLIPFLNYALLPDTSAAVFQSIQGIMDGTAAPQAAMDAWEAAALKEYSK